MQSYGWAGRYNDNGLVLNGAFLRDNRYQITFLLTTAGGWREPDDEDTAIPLEVIF